MLIILTDDGLRLLPIMGSFPTFFLLIDHDSIFKVRRADMLCGIAPISAVTFMAPAPVNIIAQTA